jgi:hypothetical protein
MRARMFKDLHVGPNMLFVQGDRRESDGFKKKKYSVDFQLEMDLFLQN